jgi:plastocyanin
MKDFIQNRSRASVITTITTPIALAALVTISLFVGGCGSSSSSTTPTTPSTCVVGQVPTNPECVNPANLLTVTIKNGVYSPNPVMVTVGQSVNWLNADAIAHTATDPGVFDTGSIAPTSAADAPVVFNTVGTFSYHCTIHPTETASIVVSK